MNIRILFLAALLTALSACGLKRNLDMPGSAHYNEAIGKSPTPAQAPSGAPVVATITFAAPDDKTLAAMKALPEPLPANTKSAWLNVAEGEEPYLFVMPPDRCGSSDCTILGFKRQSTQWVKVYEEFGGDGLTILAAKTLKHNDLQQNESRAAGNYIAKIARWKIDHYAPVSSVLTSR